MGQDAPASPATRPGMMVDVPPGARPKITLPPRLVVLATLRSGVRQAVEVDAVHAAGVMTRLRDAMRDGSLCEIRDGADEIIALLDGDDVVAVACLPGA